MLSKPSQQFSVFGFRLTIQNTANRHVSNAFDLIAVFISFPLRAAAVASADICCCCCAPPPACPRHLMFGAISAVLRAQGHHHRGHVLGGPARPRRAATSTNVGTGGTVAPCARRPARTPPWCTGSRAVSVRVSINWSARQRVHA